MTPTKLSDSEKLEIVELYQTTEENTITLADRYGVSSSTIRRILQASIPEDKYKDLVQQKQKRPSRSSKNISHGSDELNESKPRESRETTEKNQENEDEVTKPVKRQRQRSSSSSSSENTPLTEFPKLSLNSQNNYKSKDKSESDSELPKEQIEDIIAVDLLEKPQNLEDFEDDLEDFEDDFDDQDKFDPEEDLEIPYNISIQNPSSSELKIYNLTESVLPKICYVVVDKFTELVTRPLIAFGELGQIPVEESQEKTLPVFDNHRVAYRFSARNQRVLKVPDGKMLQKTTVYLQAKGITRLLIDGQVYKL